METDFLQLTIAYPRNREEELEAILIDSGMTGSEVVDLQTIVGYEANQPESELSQHEELVESLQAEMKGLEMLTSDEMAQHIFFLDSPEGWENLKRLKQRFVELQPDGVRLLSETTVDNSHWDEEWRKTYRPLSIGETIEIVPAWMEPAHMDRMILRIDPGMAFGTGTHETTDLCLQMLEKEDLIGKRGLDMGTGSGILSIYMKKAGMDEVIATDIEEDALAAARANARRNGVYFDTVQSDLFQSVEGKFDVICANLLAELVIRMIPVANAHLQKGGSLILSGILKAKEKQVRQALEQEYFHVSHVEYAGDWMVIKAERSLDANL